jgi:hypothetical protein
VEHYRQTSIQEEVEQLYQMHIADVRMKQWDFYLENLKKLSKLGANQYPLVYSYKVFAVSWTGASSHYNIKMKIPLYRNFALTILPIG